MQDDVLLAYQLSFDLFENDSQAFNFKVIACHSPMSVMTMPTEDCRRVCCTASDALDNTLIPSFLHSRMWACR